MAMDEEERRPKPVPKHEIGSDLSAVSIHELDERIALLEEEVERLRAEKERKRASKDAASAFFR